MYVEPCDGILFGFCDLPGFPVLRHIPQKTTMCIFLEILIGIMGLYHEDLLCIKKRSDHVEIVIQSAGHPCGAVIQFVNDILQLFLNEFRHRDMMLRDGAKRPEPMVMRHVIPSSFTFLLPPEKRHKKMVPKVGVEPTRPGGARF